MARLEETVERRVPHGTRLRVLAVATDAIGLLAFPYSVLAVTHGQPNAALAASGLATFTIAVRAVLTARYLEASTEAIWRATVAAAARYPVLATKSRSEKAESVTLLIESTHTSAQHEAVTVPHAIASMVALGVVGIATVFLLGPMALVLGGLVVGGIGGFMLLAHRKLAPIRQQGWADFGELALQVRVLLEGTTELRAHGRERAFTEGLLERARAVARAERRASTWSGLMGFWPLAVATTMVAAPMQAGVAWARSLFTVDNAPELGLLGATGLVLVWNVARALQASAMDAPTRRALDDFVARAPRVAAKASADAKASAPDLRAADITIEHLSVVHTGSSSATPSDVSFVWKPNRGLAVTGVNGAGKSTLALVLLGLLDCTEGRITIGNLALGDIDMTSLRRRIAYVPQGAFISPGATVGWHLGLLLDTPPAASRAVDALAKVGLLDVLRGHAGKGGDVLEVSVAKLSGGERQRMLLARALLQDAELMIFDEPEVALDAEGRTLLRRLLEELSATRRVLVIAHDVAIVPTTFAHLTLQRGDFVARALAAE
jgi:ABC-type multidrug transport system fused ATPase/permease subunit